MQYKAETGKKYRKPEVCSRRDAAFLSSRSIFLPPKRTAAKYEAGRREALDIGATGIEFG